MPLISYIGFAIVVILLIAFLAWAFEEPAGGVIMIVVGIIYFMTGWSHTFGIIAGIGGICAYVHAKNKKKKDEVASKNEFCRRELYKLLDSCWNPDTREFNWKMWKEGDWVFAYGEEKKTELENITRSELASMGKSQIRWINNELRNMVNATYRDRGAMYIKEKESTIVSKLLWMFDYYDLDSELCNEVKEYQQDIYSYIIYENKQLNSEKLSSMIERGDSICNYV